MIVVAGGGPAGAAAATLLAMAGRAVTLLERHAGPVEKICGEFLSGEAGAVFSRLGLDAGLLGGHRIGAVRLIRGRVVAEAALPFPATGLSRARLDEALLEHAAASGVDVRRGVTVAQVEHGAVRLAGGARIAAATLLLATGKHDVRGLRRAAVAEDLVGFKMHYAVAAPALRALSGHVEIVVFRDAYLGLQRIEGERVNLCLLVRRRWLEEAGGTFAAVLEAMLHESPHLRARMATARPLLPRPLSIARVPYGFLHRPRDGEDVFRLGDQAVVIPSFSGDGMALALHSARLASAMILRGEGAAAYHRRLRHDVGPQLRRAGLLYRVGARPAGQAAMVGLAARWPGALRLAARLTRVPERAAAG